MRTFENKKYGEIRSIEKEGKTWFVGKDVSDFLGYSKLCNMTGNRVNKEEIITSTIGSNKGRPMNFLDEKSIRYIIERVATKRAKQAGEWILKNLFSDTDTKSDTPLHNKTFNDEIKTFRNKEFGSLRTVEIDEHTWFVGKDIAEILGYTNPQKAIRDHVDEEDKTLNESFTVNGTNGILINESGLYTLILSSKMSNAKKFKRWVTTEILPSIRKHGIYATDNAIESMLENPDVMIKTLEALKKEREKAKFLDAENKLLSQEVLNWEDKKYVEAIVKKIGTAISDYALAWNEFKKELLYKHSINLNARMTHEMNRTGKKPKTLDMIHDEELQACISTAVAIARKNNVNIADVLSKLQER